MNGHMIKFELYEKSNNFQCHTNNLGSFVVSISHYMRAYFNYQALLRGENFKLPSDAGYLNCVLLQQTAYSDTKLYAKIGCLEKDSSTSTKLQLHVYTDKQCSTPYDDGLDSSKFRKGYNINGYYFSSKVSFRPPFYSCMNCKPETIADSFSKRKTFWYDDDAAANGYQIYKYFDDWLDDYFLNDDAYFKVQEYTNNEVVYTRDDDDNFYTIDDDDATTTKKSWWSHRDLKQIEGQKLEENVVTEKKEVSRNLMGSNQKEFEAKDGALEVRIELFPFYDELLVVGMILHCNYFYRTMKRTSGWSTLRFVSLEMETPTVTMMTVLKHGTCVKKCTNTVYGVTKIVEQLMLSVLMSGLLLISSFLPSCVYSWHS